MTILVTGGTGFLGGALVRQLLGGPQPIRVVARNPSKARDLQALGVEVVQGDVLDAASMQAAMQGVQTLYHVAAVYDFWMPNKRDIVQIAVEGTRNVLQAALDAGVERVVYTSSYNTIGEQKGTVGNEQTVHRGHFLAVYEEAKVKAEQVALEHVQKGLPVVLVNPGSIYGPGDFKPSGKVLIQSIQGKLPGILAATYNYVFIDDVVQGHLLAAEKGVVGERYLLAAERIDILDFVNHARALVGLSPTPALPPVLGLMLGYASEGLSVLTRKPPMVPLDLVKVGLHGIQVDGSRATRELGLQYTPKEVGLPITLDWYIRQGVIRGPLVQPLQ